MNRTLIILSTIIFFLPIYSCLKPENIVSIGSWGFSPNGDGINDVFILPTEIVDTTLNNRMTIIDTRSNKLVLKVTEYHKKWWNGKINNNGELVSEGLYKFALEINDLNSYWGYVYVKY